MWFHAVARAFSVDAHAAEGPGSMEINPRANRPRRESRRIGSSLYVTCVYDPEGRNQLIMELSGLSLAGFRPNSEGAP